MRTEAYAQAKVCNGLAGETSLASMPQLRSLFERLLQRGEEGQALAERIANAGREFAREQLSASALHCYWRLVLEHYASLYFT